MSRQLPEKPDLEHLKKQAKQLLRTMPGSKLADAQHATANEYGFPTWTALKRHVESLGDPAEALQAAVLESDAARVRELLKQHPTLRAKIDGPMPTYGFGGTALFAAVQRGDRATIDALLEAGANINQRTHWWAGGFGALDDCAADLVEFLTDRGAVVDACAAARLGRLSRLRELVAADPAAVHQRGGDGQTPLHFASTVEIAEFLLAHGADIDALDVDHESTPAQYMLRVEHVRHYPRNRQDVARYLVSRGCRTDILMAAALGDAALVRKHLDANPGCIRTDVSPRWFPQRDPRAGGTIYIWQLGKYRTAHTVARDFGHEDVFQLLMERTPDDLKLALACELGDESAFREMMAKRPGLAESLSKEDQQKLPDAAQSNNTNAVRLMLQAGWPVNTRGEMGATALHWAGWNGNAEMARAILQHHPDLELKSLDHASPALAWTLFGSENGWHRETGDYGGTVRALLEAGAVAPPCEGLEASEAALAALRGDTT